jgi:hypothetical protein
MKFGRLAFIAALVASPATAQIDPPLLVQAEAQSLTPFCTGRDVQIEGNHNVVKPFGLCRSLLLKGIANDVVLDLGAGATIRVEGSANHVTYRGPAISGVDLLGADNIVTAPEIVPSGEEDALALTGDDQARVMDCAGRNVTIRGERSLYMLRGGCRSLTIRGDLVVVQAELASNAAVTVAGQGITVGWAPVDHGHAPTESVHGEGSHIERLEEIGGLPVR